MSGVYPFPLGFSPATALLPKKILPSLPAAIRPMLDRIALKSSNRWPNFITRLLPTDFHFVALNPFPKRTNNAGKNTVDVTAEAY